MDQRAMNSTNLDLKRTASPVCGIQGYPCISSRERFSYADYRQKVLEIAAAKEIVPQYAHRRQAERQRNWPKCLLSEEQRIVSSPRDDE